MTKLYYFGLLITFIVVSSFQSIAQNNNNSEKNTSNILKSKKANSKIKVFLLGGQSNMTGWTPLSEIPNEMRHEYPEVIIWADGEAETSLMRKWMNLIPGLGKSVSYLGPELTFGPELAKYFPDEKIALLKCSWAGTDLVTQWRPPSSGKTIGYLYENFIKSVHDGLAALPAGTEFEIAGMIWMQGESDAIQTKAVADEYEYNLTNLINDIRSEFKVPQMKFVIGQISEAVAWDAFGSTIRKAQLDVSKNVPNTSMIITADFGLTDPAHYNGDGQIKLGQRFATSMYNVISARGLRSELFNTSEFVNPKVTRVDTLINFNWGSSSPDNAVDGNNYSIRWAGYIRPQNSGVYSFYINTTNGVKLWVDDVLIINSPDNNSQNVLTGEITLNSGVYSSIKLEYIKNTDNASITLEWSANGIAKQLVPSTVFYQFPLYAVDKSRWTISSFDSQIRTVAAYGGAKGVLDNNYNSFWRTMPGTAFPHEIAIDFNDTLNVASLDYVPNQIDTTAGYALQYKVYSSIDGSNWSNAVDSGVWKSNPNLKTSRFMPVVARYIKLQILSSSDTTVSAADISIHGVLSKSRINTTNVINTHIDEKLIIYPNPVNDIISIKLNDFSRNENVKLTFYNSLGQSVFNYKMDTNREISFDCRQILKRGGVYFLEAKSTTNSYKQKIVFDQF